MIERSLDDIRYVLNPTLTTTEIQRLDQVCCCPVLCQQLDVVISHHALQQSLMLVGRQITIMWGRLCTPL